MDQAQQMMLEFLSRKFEQFGGLPDPVETSDWLYSNVLYEVGINVNQTQQYTFAQGPKRPADYENFFNNVLKHVGQSLPKRQWSKKVKRSKNNEEASRLRNEGNRMFAMKNDLGFKESLEFYTKSIAHAAPGSKELALGYSNRSAALFELDSPKECVEDIERALQLASFPVNLKPKLYLRRAECLSKLSRLSYIESKFWMKALPLNDDGRSHLEKTLKKYPAKIKHKEKFVNEASDPPKLKSPHDKYPFASDAIDLEYSKSAGRRIVAARDIEVGEVLIVEKPCFTYLDIPKLYTHCSHCMTSMWAGIPCDYCVNVVYCSAECQKNAWKKYHQMDCLFFDLMLQYQCPLSGGQCAKFLMQVILEAGGLEPLKERLKKFKDCKDFIEWPLNEEWFRDQPLEVNFQLVTHAAKMDRDRLREVTLGIVRTIFILSTYTNFFGKQYNRDKMYDADILLEMSKNPDVKFIGGLLLRIYLVLLTNEYESDERNFVKTTKRGAVLVPFYSLLNHSCCPNSYTYIIGANFVLHSMLPIKKGDEVTVTYGPLYHSEEIMNRHENLKIRYYFTCSCIACENDWPLYKKLKSYKRKAKSDSCKSQIKKALSSLPDIQMKIAMADLREKDELLDRLYNMMKVVYSGVSMPCQDIIDIMSAIESIYNQTGNSSKLHWLHSLI